MNVKERHDEAEKEYRSELVKQLEVIGEPLLEGEVIDVFHSDGRKHGEFKQNPWLENDTRAIPTGEWTDFYYGMVKEKGKVMLLLANDWSYVGHSLADIKRQKDNCGAWPVSLDWTDCTCIKNLEALITALNETKGNL